MGWKADVKLEIRISFIGITKNPFGNLIALQAIRAFLSEKHKTILRVDLCQHR